MKEENRNISKLIRFNNKEYGIIVEQAKKNNMNVSNFLRYRAMNIPYSNPEMLKAIYKLVNEVNFIGHNINQIVRNNNSRIYIEDDKDRLIEYMRIINKKVDVLLKQYGNQ